MYSKNVVVNKFQEANKDSWIRRILPLCGFLLISTMTLKFYWNFPLADPINYGAWSMFFLLCLYKYRDLKEEKKKQKLKPKPPPEDFYV